MPSEKNLGPQRLVEVDSLLSMRLAPVVFLGVLLFSISILNLIDIPSSVTNARIIKMRSFKYGTNMENQATLSLVIFDKSPKTAIFYKKSTLIFKNAEGKVVEGTLNEETHCKRPPFSDSCLADFKLSFRGDSMLRVLASAISCNTVSVQIKSPATSILNLLFQSHK